MKTITPLQQQVLEAYLAEKAAGRRCGTDALAKILGRTRDSVKRSLSLLRREGAIEPAFPVGEMLPPKPFDLTAPPEEISSLRHKLAEAHKQLQQYRESHGDMQGFIRDLCDHVLVMSPPEIVYRKPTGNRVSSPIALVIHNTDWHMGSVQDPDEIEGFNQFSPAILRKRIVWLVDKVLEWTAVHRTNYDVDECRVLVTGDLINGEIHPELVSSNEFPSAVQCVEAGYLLADEISLLSPHFKRVVVDMVLVDNHGRLSKKPQHKQGGYNTYNYPLAEIAKQRLARHANVEFRYYPCEQQVVDVKGRKYLLCHGHQVRGWAGLPWYGLQRKVGLESTKRLMAEHSKFHRIIMGHFHTPICHPYFWLGGSASGTDSFDHSEGRHSEPIQSTWFVHPKHAEFDRTEWELTGADE